VLKASAYNIGDRVRYSGKHPEFTDSSMIGKLGKVVSVPANRTNNVRVKWDHLDYPHGHYAENIERVSASTPQFRAGDRVYYTATMRPGYADNSRSKYATGTVESAIQADNVIVKWDAVQGRSTIAVPGYDGVLPANLSKLPHTFKPGDRVYHSSARQYGTVKNIDASAALVRIEWDHQNGRANGGFNFRDLAHSDIPKPVTYTAKPKLLNVGDFLRIIKAGDGYNVGDIVKIVRVDLDDELLPYAVKKADGTSRFNQGDWIYPHQVEAYTPPPLTAADLAKLKADLKAELRAAILGDVKSALRLAL